MQAREETTHDFLTDKSHERIRASLKIWRLWASELIFMVQKGQNLRLNRTRHEQVKEEKRK